LHITHLFFFHQLSQAIGKPAARQWLATALVNDSSALSNTSQTVGRHDAPVRNKCGSEKCDIDILQLEVNTKQGNISKSALSISLHAWDISSVELHTEIQLARTRSSPAVISPQSEQRKDIDATKIGLLFTDAAHIVVNDLDKYSHEIASATKRTDGRSKE
jgi:hypothetical protein